MMLAKAPMFRALAHMLKQRLRLSSKTPGAPYEEKYRVCWLFSCSCLIPAVPCCGLWSMMVVSRDWFAVL